MKGSSLPIRVFLLGKFEITHGARVLRASDWSRRKAAALLQRLALERRLTKDQAIEFLWQDADPASGANNLYRTVHALRQTLDTALGTGSADAMFAFQDGVLTLNDPIWVDAHEFETQVRPATANHPLPITNLQSLLDLYAGDLLPDDLYADWTQVPRDALSRLFREASLALAAQYRDARDYPRAIALLSRLVTRDPADELAHRELMRAYALAGRRHDALRQYQILRDALAKELDVPPDPATAALYAQILSGELLPMPARAARTSPATIPVPIVTDAPLVGRASEFDILHTRIRDAAHGQGKTLLLAGDAGVGKTRLAFELLRDSAAQEMLPLAGAAYEQEGQLPYQPFIEAFDRYLTEHPRAVEQNPITHFKRIGSSDPQQEQWALFKSVATFLTELPRPVVLWIDDLHAADEASLRLFHYLARSTRGAPVVLLAAYRADVIAATTPFSTLLNALYRERLSETLTLAPLAQDATAQVLEQVLNGRAASDLVATVYDIAEGNPFYVQEIARALQKTNQIEKTNGAWNFRQNDHRDRSALRVPADLSGLLRERVARLGAQVESGLSAAAVLGREFDYETLRGVTVLPDNELLDALDAALAAHLLAETESGYRFRHALIRRALYDSLHHARRAQLHTRAAEAIEAVSARRPEGDAPFVEALAFHYDLSDHRDRALAYLVRAGRKAADVFAFEAAVDYFERALALMDARGLADPARRWTLLESLGWWYNILANTPRAVERFEQALALKPAPNWEASWRDRVRLRCGAAIALITAGNLDQAEAHLHAGLAEADTREDAAEYADLLYNVAQFHWHRGEYRAAFDAAQKSLSIADRIDKPDAIARAFEMLALACHSLGEWQTGIYYEQRRASLVGPDLDVTDAFDVHL